ncbi:serine hydrolase [Williamsia maris]|uniref:CubicO group peptidase, beta-lactamase class C family n=2 Tax=Williamsia maris TaxID=72806 RepID=A0ABT1HG19_9NOCA|nr:serine hydrolase [Williamsia maris]MCP2175846.1 CubicO group peptidase, beta-lactamase class C family [Williamsia maris]
MRASVDMRRDGHRQKRAWTTAISLVAVCALGAACDSGSSSGPAASSASDGADVNAAAANPIAPGAIDNAVGQIDGMVDELMRTTGTPGMAVAVVHGGKQVYAKGFGVANMATGAKVDADTVFQLASVSKSVGSSVVAAEVTKKAITWDTPIVANLPSFALSDPWVTTHVTVADMYSHRSGLPEHAGDKLESIGYSQQDVLARMRSVPLSPFRATYDYTNFGLTAAAESVAAKSGKDWATLSADTIYTPLGMSSTSSRYSDFISRPDHAIGHIKIDGKWAPTTFQREPDAQSPAGGVSSSVNDMSHWLEMMLGDGTYQGRQIVSPESMVPAISPEIVSNPPAGPADRTGFYGYGFNSSVTADGRTMYSHSGAFSSGAGTNFVAIPSADVAIVTLTNAAPTGAAESLGMQFADLVQYGERRTDWFDLYGPAFEDQSKPFGSLVGVSRPAPSTPTQPLASYAGTYTNGYYGPATVSERDGRLQLSLGPDGRATYPLTHWSGNEFTYSMRDENAEDGSISKVTFDGPAMTVEYYDDEESNGVFTR